MWFLTRGVASTRELRFWSRCGPSLLPLLLLVINNLGDKPPGALGERLVILLLPAEIIGETFGTRASFLIAGFLEFFFAYLIGLLSWTCIRAGKRAK